MCSNPLGPERFRTDGGGLFVVRKDHVATLLIEVGCGCVVLAVDMYRRWLLCSENAHCIWCMKPFLFNHLSILCLY